MKALKERIPQGAGYGKGRERCRSRGMLRGHILADPGISLGGIDGIYWIESARLLSLQWKTTYERKRGVTRPARIDWKCLHWGQNSRWWHRSCRQCVQYPSDWDDGNKHGAG